MTRYIAGRPLGLGLVVASLMINGLTALIAAFDLAGLTSGHGPGAALISLGLSAGAAAALVGLGFFFRAYMLWTYHQGAWWITLILTGLSAASAILSVDVAPSHLISWLYLGVSIATIAILLGPNVRASFR